MSRLRIKMKLQIVRELFWILIRRWQLALQRIYLEESEMTNFSLSLTGERCVTFQWRRSMLTTLSTRSRRCWYNDNIDRERGIISCRTVDWTFEWSRRTNRVNHWKVSLCLRWQGREGIVWWEIAAWCWWRRPRCREYYLSNRECKWLEWGKYPRPFEYSRISLCHSFVSGLTLCLVVTRANHVLYFSETEWAQPFKDLQWRTWKKKAVTHSHLILVISNKNNAFLRSSALRRKYRHTHLTMHDIN